MAMPGPNVSGPWARLGQGHGKSHGQGPWRGWHTVAISLSLSASPLFLSRRILSQAPAAASYNSPFEPKKSILERFPLKAAKTAGALAVTGDAIAQVVERRKRERVLRTLDEKRKQLLPFTHDQQGLPGRLRQFVQKHDFVRALRMGSYGFLLYGPLSQIWYQFLEKHLPGAGPRNLALKVAANQVFLGPCVLLVVFTWNFAWMGRLGDVPAKLKKDFAPSLVDGWKFWIPASTVNFALVPLGLRVAYMSSCAIFWNFYLSTLVGKDGASARQQAQ